MQSTSLGILCGLCLAVFVTLEARPARLFVVFAPAFALTVLGLGFSRAPDAVWMSSGLAAAAAVALFRPAWCWLAIAGAGAAAAVWAILLAAAGLPTPLAVVTVLAVAGTSATLAVRRPRFAPQVLREEALVVVLLLALGIAITPSLIEGFASATALTAQPLGGESIAAPVWPLALAGACVSLGCAFSLWRRR